MRRQRLNFENVTVIDLIIPVYSGESAVRRCLDSVFRSDIAERVEVIVIDDASPEPAISAFLRELASKQRLTLIHHAANLGFVSSVNEAASLHPERDFVVLNADTEVHGDWLQRLELHAADNPDAATITPFSNNATIASYPVLARDNELPSGLSTGKLHSLFAAANDGKTIYAPTAVGFCMWVRRKAWQQAGGFDTIFGRGYGEEVDFCCKVAKLGWCHLIAADVFVFHEGGVAFGNEATGRKISAQRIVDERYPDYSSTVEAWILEDPALPYRVAVDVERLGRRLGPRWLFVSHSFGGGVEQHTEHLAALISEHLDGVVWLLQPRDASSVSVSWIGESNDLTFSLNTDRLLQQAPHVFGRLGIQRLHFHHTAGLPQAVLQLPDLLGLPYDFTVHDFRVVCPQTHFVTKQGQFCGRPDVEGCEECTLERPDSWGIGIRRWRLAFEEWLARADRVIYPSQYVRKVIEDYFPQVQGEVWPHPEQAMSEFSGFAERSLACRKFVLIGALSAAKGLHRLTELANLSLQSEEPFEFVVVGPTLEPLASALPRNVTVTGQYDQSQLVHLLSRERSDGFLFLSVVPETYNYALSVALATGLPIWALEGGAIGERLQGVDRATVLPGDTSATQLLASMKLAESIYSVKQIQAVAEASGLPAAEYISRLISSANPDAVNPDDGASLAAFIAEKKYGETPVIGEKRGIAELLEQALDCKLREATEQLRQQALENERQLAERNAHLTATESEIEHLLSTVSELKTAEAAEQHHLLQTIADLKDAQVAEVDHLKQTIEALQRAHRESEDAIKVRLAEAMAGLQEREATLAKSQEDLKQSQEELFSLRQFKSQHAPHLAEREDLIVVLADRIAALEGSTIWRMATPMRLVTHRFKLLFQQALRTAKRCRRAVVFARYHYAQGGTSAVFEALSRRLRRRLAAGNASTGNQRARDIENVSIVNGQPLFFSTNPEPLVSIIVPTYGAHDVTKRCLTSLYNASIAIPFEIIVVDDAFDEPLNPESLSISGLHVLRNEQNLGFLKSCNKAALMGAGKYIWLLNNDTFVHPGALEAMLATFDRFGNVGAVCSKLLFEDGVLQEAGGIVWQDGSAWNWGRGENSDDPRFNYPRSVDYGSAASLLVDAEIWGTLGGFDEQFAPAYYEDTDLCFAIRALGKRVIYQPGAAVTHFEGVSHGTDTGSGLKSYQVANQSKFLEKWSRELKGHRANGVEPMLERDRGASARVLWVEACMLTPNQDSGSLRTFRLLRILAKMGCKVTFIADNLDGAEPYRSQLTDEGIEVIHSPFSSSVRAFIESRAREFDVITLCRHYIAIEYVDIARASNPKARIWFDTIDLHYLRSRRQFELDGKASTRDRADLAYKEEMTVVAKSDITVVVSDVEVAELRREDPTAKVIVISNIHEPQSEVSPPQGRSGVLFVGGFQHPPNVDAVEYYATEIWPLFQAENPGVETFIIGSQMPERLRKLGEDQGLTMLGFVDDLEPYYRRCRMAIAPLRYGAGVKGKVNQALSFGLPVVGTPPALEGMNLILDKDVLCASTERAFVDAMSRLNTDDSLWNMLSDGGLASLHGQFTPAVAEGALRAALSDILRDGDT